jgi:hypothetical protein
MKLKCLLLVQILWASFQVFAAPYTVSADGQEVTDVGTGLVWRRCVEGMTFTSGSCSGVPAVFKHEAGLVRATAQAASTGAAWRVPNIKELATLVELTSLNPAINAMAFPQSPADSYAWASTPYVSDSASAWAINFADGAIVYAPRGNSFSVRLVRAGQ